MRDRRNSVSPISGPNSWPPFPPPLESELERALREEEEKEAKKVSDAIDEVLEQDKLERRKQRAYTKILLLGQAESGKSTILKQFQLYFTPKAFQAESEAWRAVIHLNLVRSVNFILDILSGPSGSVNNAKEFISTYSTSTSPYRSGQSPSIAASSARLREMRMRLSPLRQVELILVKRLSANTTRNLSRSSVVFDDATLGYYGRASEVYVQGGSGWKALINRKQQAKGRDWQPDDLDNARQILEACKEDISMLWLDSNVQAALKDEGVMLEEQSGFFLDEAERIASLHYEPMFQDILKARLQTIGVEEHVLVVESGALPSAAEVGQTWLFYDVGGCQGQRAAWAPYFDDINAVIFLCPMASFNQVLLEDRSVNRLHDSFILWKTICGSKLLSSVTFILLLNKCDLLDTKLKEGEVFSRYVRSYKDAPNDLQHVSEYLKNKFIAIHKSQSSRKRQLHIHLTCAIDIKVMQHVLLRIREAILVDNLLEAELL